MRLLAWSIVFASGCVSIDDTPRPWVVADAIAAPLTPELGPPPAPRSAPAVLRIASWNVLRADEPERVAAEIRTSAALASADVIFVQEVETNSSEGTSRASRLAAALGMTWFYAPARVQPGNGTHGDAILSRFPLTIPEVKQLPLVDQPVNTVQRIALRAVVEIGTRSLMLVNTHLDTRLTPVDRIRQLDPAVAGNPHDVVLGGDFNTLPWIFLETLVPLIGTEAVIGQDQARVVDDYLHDNGFATPLSHDLDTHDFPIIDMRLDTLCARGWRTLDAGVDDSVAGSDHYAVWIDVVAP